jgi:hypothetical protein
MHTILSGTLGPSASLVKSPLASIAFSNSGELSCLGKGRSDWSNFLSGNARSCAPGQTHAQCFWLFFTAKFGYYTEGGWDFMAKISWMQGSFEGVQ